MCWGRFRPHALKCTYDFPPNEGLIIYKIVYIIYFPSHFCQAVEEILHFLQPAFGDMQLHRLISCELLWSKENVNSSLFVVSIKFDTSYVDEKNNIN